MYQVMMEPRVAARLVELQTEERIRRAEGARAGSIVRRATPGPASGRPTRRAWRLLLWRRAVA